MTKIVLLPAVALGMWAAAPESLEAVGDGKADATPAIQRAIDSGAGGVTLPPGRYRITRPLVVRLDRVGPVAIRGEGGARLIMEGAGPAISITGTHVKGTAAPESFRPGVWERERMPLLDGFEIVGAHPEAVGVQVDGTMQATLTRLLIRKARHGIRLTGRNRNIIISDCHIYENRGAGVLLEKLNLHQINITGSHISYNGGGGVVVRESEIRNIHIGTCDIESNMAADGPPTANVLFDARAGTIREGAIVGCTIQHNHQAPDSANIRFLGHSAEDPMRVGFMAISSNALSDVAVNIHLKHARGVTIANNVFWKGYRHNVLVEGSSRIVMGPNLFDRSPAYGATDSRDALEFTDTTDSTITGVHIEDVAEAAAALTLRRCRRVNITGATVLRGATAGILLEDVEGVRVSDCILESLRPGPRVPPALRLTGGRGNMILHNLHDGALEIAENTAVAEGNQVMR